MKALRRKPIVAIGANSQHSRASGGLQIPSSLKVAPHRYQITYEDLPSVGDSKLLGQTDNSELTIKIDKSMTETKQVETFLHEAVHAMDDWAGTGFTEDQVERFSKVLYQVLV